MRHPGGHDGHPDDARGANTRPQPRGCQDKASNTSPEGIIWRSRTYLFSVNRTDDRWIGRFIEYLIEDYIDI